VHHLREREAGCEQLRAVPHCCPADRVGTRCRVGQVESKRLLELLEKERNTMFELADRLDGQTPPSARWLARETIASRLAEMNSYSMVGLLPARNCASTDHADALVESAEVRYTP